MKIEIGKRYTVLNELNDVDIRNNEEIEILDIGEDNYKVLNINLGTVEAWSIIPKCDLEYMLGV